MNELFKVGVGKQRKSRLFVLLLRVDSAAGRQPSVCLLDGVWDQCAGLECASCPAVSKSGSE